MNIELKGVISKIFNAEKITENLTKRQVVINIEPETQYSQPISVEAINGKISLLDDFKENDYVIMEVTLRGKLSTKDRYFNQLLLYKITKVK